MTSGNLKIYFVVGPSWGTGKQAPSLWLARKLKMENCNLENIQWLNIFRDPHKVNKLKRNTELKALCFLRNGSLWNRIPVRTASRAIGRTNIPCLLRNKSRKIPNLSHNAAPRETWALNNSRSRLTTQSHKGIFWGDGSVVKLVEVMTTQL